MQTEPLCHTYIGGSPECIEAILSNPDLEALPTTLDASTYLNSDTINAPEIFQGGSERAVRVSRP